MHRVDDINVMQLLLDIENPRFADVASQKDAFLAMIDNQKDRIVKLANDIVKEGVNPADLPIVVPHDEREGQFIVVEGNRRITALRLLHEPSIAGNRASVRKQFLKLQEKFKDNIINEVKCVIFPQKEDAIHWIDLKHTGANKGVGTVEWATIEKERFQARIKGKTSLPLQIIKFLKDSGELDSDLNQKIDNISITNVGRLVNDPDIRDALGIHTKNSKLYSSLPPKEVVKGLIKMVRDLVNENIKVKDIYSKKDRVNYLKKFERDDLPDFTQPSPKPWAFDAAPAVQPKVSNNDTPSKTIKKKRILPLSTKRKSIIPSSCPLTIREKKINSIYWELRSIDTEKFSNASAVLLRVFLELSVDHYIDTMDIEIKKSKDNTPTLNKKIQVVADFLEDKKILLQNQLKGARTAAAQEHSLFSTNTFNAYVHNRFFSPDPTQLKITWDNMQLFVEKLWE
ncbi:MAG: hypothetical protein OEY01_16515 [Desulfobulbaceae bacterium]|nr:hypothetical protein [Desulfobulbaceae bacterium]